MQINILGKCDPDSRELYDHSERKELLRIGQGFVFVDYLPEDIFINDVFILDDGTEIILREIKLQFDTKEPLTEMGHGWKCLCRFEGLDLDKLPSVRDWFKINLKIVARRKD